MEEVPNLRPHQITAITKIKETLKNYDKCLVKMFCGTGKTLIAFDMMTKNNYNCSVIIFPSISLITQFNVDYINKYPSSTKNFKFMSVCSRNETTLTEVNVKYTTDPDTILNFFNKSSKKIICVTYQSLENFVECVEQSEKNIDIIIYDEAHHIVGSKIQKLVFENEEFGGKCKKTIFLTATPKNEGGIIMKREEEEEEEDYECIDSSSDEDDGSDDEDSESFNSSFENSESSSEEFFSHCGPLAFEYTHYQAVRDINPDTGKAVCNDFDIAIDFYTDTEYKYKSTFSAIARCIFSTDNTKCLTFHSFSEAEKDGKSFVNDFTSDENKNKFMKEYNEVLKEFPKKENKYMNKLYVDGLTGKTKDKKKILDHFDQDDKKVHVLASCNTIGEGIDTKNANIVCFVDPKNSFSATIQNIGRVCRLQTARSIVLIPCYVDAKKYAECKSPEERDKVLREDMSDKGDFTNILNVLSALKHDDPKMYNLCLKYPKKYAPKEIKENLESFGYKIGKKVGDGKLGETIGMKEEIEEKDLEDVCKKLEKKIEIHSCSMEEPIKVYGGNDEGKEVLRLYKGDDGYRKIHAKNVKGAQGKIKKPSRKSFSMKVHQSSDVGVLWDLEKGFDLSEKVCQVYLESFVKDDKWYEKLELCKKFIEYNKRLPLRSNENEKSLFNWVTTQKYNYKNHKESMSDREKRKLWEEFLEKYKNLFESFDDIFYKNLDMCKKFIDENLKRPFKESLYKGEKKLGVWVSDQFRNYDKKNRSMSDPKKREVWENFTKEYKSYFKSNDDKWDNKFTLCKKFINISKKLPSPYSEDSNEKKLGIWVSNQCKNYKSQTNSMKDLYRCKIWEEFTEKFKIYFKGEDWYEQLDHVKKFININKKHPSASSENTEEAKRGNWVNTQKYNYKRNKGILSHPKEREMWKDFVEEYEQYFRGENYWDKCFGEIKIFIDIRGKPSGSSRVKEEKKKGRWITTQLGNYKNNKGFAKDPLKRKAFEDFVTDPKYSPFFPSFTIIPLPTQNPSTIPPKPSKKFISKPQPVKLIPEQSSQKTHETPIFSPLTTLHQKYKSMTSENLHNLFTENNSQLFHEYHKISTDNEATFQEQDKIPYKQIIKYLENLNFVGEKNVADLGCGEARVSRHFSKKEISKRSFKFYNFDHVAVDDTVVKCNIKKTPLPDHSMSIVILCLSLWGTDFAYYIREAKRILEDNGVLLIIEAVKKWTNREIFETDKIDEGDKLKRLLADAKLGFKIKNIISKDKFIFLECMK